MYATGSSLYEWCQGWLINLQYSRGKNRLFPCAIEFLSETHEVVTVIIFKLEKQESSPYSLFTGSESQYSTPDLPDSRTYTVTYYIVNFTKFNGLEESLDAAVQNNN